MEELIEILKAIESDLYSIRMDIHNYFYNQKRNNITYECVSDYFKCKYKDYCEYADSCKVDTMVENAEN